MGAVGYSLRSVAAEMPNLVVSSLLWLSFLIGAQTVGGERSLQNKSISGTVLA